MKSTMNIKDYYWSKMSDLWDTGYLKAGGQNAISSTTDVLPKFMQKGLKITRCSFKSGRFQDSGLWVIYI